MTKLLLCSLAALAAAMAVGATAPSQTPSLVRVDGGELQRVMAAGVVSFKGIPFLSRRQEVGDALAISGEFTAWTLARSC